MLSSAAVRLDGTLWVWGSGSSAQMGDGVRHPSPDNPGGRDLLPLQVRALPVPKTWVSAPGRVALLLNGGTVRAWGMNGCGSMGLARRLVAEAVPSQGACNLNVATLHLGGYDSYAIRPTAPLSISGFSLARAAASCRVTSPLRRDSTCPA